MTIFWTISNSYEVLSFVPVSWGSWLGVSPFGILTKWALKWGVKNLGSGCMSLGWNLSFTGFVTFLNLIFLSVQWGWRSYYIGWTWGWEKMCAGPGATPGASFCLRTHPEFTSAAVAAGWAPSPTSVPQGSVLYTAVRVILLTFKSHHITPLLKTFRGFHFTWSKSQDHRSSHKVPQAQPLRLSLFLLFSPISLPSNHTLLLAVPQTSQPHSCLRTFACSVLVAGMLFPQLSSWLPLLSPSGRYSDVAFSMRTSLLFFPIYFCLWHLSPSSISCHTFNLFPMVACLSPVWFLQENSCKSFLQENVSSLRAGIFVFVFTICNGVQ